MAIRCRSASGAPMSRAAWCTICRSICSRTWSRSALISTQPSLIVGRKDLPPNNLKELIAWLKANPGKVSVGTSGPGSPSHVFGSFFQNTIQAKFDFIPYRSAGNSQKDLVGGQVDMIVDTPSTSGQNVKGGLIKASSRRQRPHAGAAGHSDRRRGGPAGNVFLLLARAVGAQGHAQARHRQAQRGGDEGGERSGDPRAAGEDRPGVLPDDA